MALNQQDREKFFEQQVCESVRSKADAVREDPFVVRCNFNFCRSPKSSSQQPLSQ